MAHFYKITIFKVIVYEYECFGLENDIMLNDIINEYNMKDWHVTKTKKRKWSIERKVDNILVFF